MDAQPVEQPVEVLTEPGRRRWSRRTTVVVWSVVLGLALTTYVVDGRVRTGEERALASCARQANVAVHAADEQVATELDFVRPVLDNGAPPGVLRRMYQLIGQAARGTDRGLDPALRACAAIHVLSVHGDLKARRDACVSALRGHAAYLRRVSEDGAAVLHWQYLGPRCPAPG